MKNTILSSAVLAMSLVGDTLLYATLPSYFGQLHVPLLWVGVILSVNRLIRPVLNPLALGLFKVYGFKSVTALGVLMAGVSTLGYGLASSLWLWILLRLFWAFAFAILRLSALQYAISQTSQHGLHLGVSRAVQESGPILALWLAPLVLAFVNLNSLFLALGIITLFAFTLVGFMPDKRLSAAQVKWEVHFLPSGFNAITFLLSFVYDGLLVVLLAPLLATFIHQVHIAEWVAFYLIVKRLTVLGISPIAGIIADRMGLHRVFATGIVGSMLGLVLSAWGLASIGICISFLSGSICSALAPGGSVANAGSQVRALSVNATWRDLGAGAGTFVAGFFITLTDFSLLFTAAACLLTVCFLFYKYKSTIQTIFV